MSEMKFTPGPWRLLPGFAYLNRLSVTLQTGDGKLNLARIFLNGARSREEGTANARLIAAAPEMYEALLALANRFSYIEGTQDGHLLSSARAAIEKAGRA